MQLQVNKDYNNPLIHIITDVQLSLTEICGNKDLFEVEE